MNTSGLTAVTRCLVHFGQDRISGWDGARQVDLYLRILVSPVLSDATTASTPEPRTAGPKPEPRPPGPKPGQATGIRRAWEIADEVLAGDDRPKLEHGWKIEVAKRVTARLSGEKRFFALGTVEKYLRGLTHPDEDGKQQTG